MYNELCFFGCSFTALENSPTKHEFVNHRYLISNELNTPQKSFAYTGKSNQHIINDVYLTSKEDIHRNSFFIIQYTFFNRLGMYSDVDGDNFVSMCKRNIDDSCSYPLDIQINFYRDWLKYFYSNKNGVLEFEKQVDTISSWLKQSNIPFISYGYDLGMDNFSDKFYKRNNFIKFDETYSLYNHISKMGLRIIDLYETHKLNDNHLSANGHSYLAEIICDKIRSL